METVLWVLLSVIGVVIMGALFLYFHFRSTYNLMIALDQRCDTAFADIDVHLKHRHNLIPGLVNLTKGVADHEKEMIFGIMESRNQALKNFSNEMKLQAEGNLTAQLTNLVTAFDKIPDIKALPEFSKLRNELTDCENRITAARRFHNLAIEEYNTVMRQFPGNIIAKKLRMNSRQQFDLGVERMIIDEPVAIAF